MVEENTKESTPEFVKEIRIAIRSSPYLKRIAEKRAEELGLDLSKYVRSLIKNDVKKNKGKELF